MDKMKPSVREIVSSAVFMVFIGVLFILNFVVPAPEILVSERRFPAKFPKLDITTVSDGSFMSKFDGYAADRFVFRDTFRAIRAFTVFDVFRQTDKSGLYRSRDVGLGEFRRSDAASFRQTAEKIKTAAESFNGYDMNIYYSLVPDKSTFAERYMPGFDIDAAENILFELMGDYEYIRLADKIGAGSFYKTDLHWDQTKIADVTNHLLASMGASPAIDGYPVITAGDFKGVYAGQVALPTAPDSMAYLDIPNLKVSYLSEKTLEFETGPVYDTERFTGVDPYDLFLRGPQPLIVIENESAPKRELYLFRDSFGSSLAPLLAGSYSKVTVIDLRYFHISLLGQFVEFVPGSDVLFIYGSQIFNNPSILQV